MFLIPTDYDKLIQANNLNQLVSNDLTQKVKMELAAQAEMTSYLTQRYDVTKVFQDTNSFNFSSTYLAGNWVYLDGQLFDNAIVYAINTFVLSAGNVYFKNSYTTGYVASIPPSNTTYFTLLGKQYDFFYVFYPYPNFDIRTTYLASDKVFWKDKIYTSISGALGFFPDNSFFWSSGVPFSVTATMPSDATKWKAGDNRNQQIVLFLVDMTLYHLHRRIAPRDIPQHRIDAYDSAVCWLKMAGRGEITADLPLIVQDQGNRIRYGSNPRNINSY